MPLKNLFLAHMAQGSSLVSSLTYSEARLGKSKDLGSGVSVLREGRRQLLARASACLIVMKIRIVDKRV